MKSAHTSYNERSWAIDLIGHIKQLANSNSRPIKDSGGEQTIKTEGGSLFPDVLLFGDRETARILQGWELKMPDTGIENSEFKNNAETKARALGLDSFVLWNVSIARLYVLNSSNNEFICEKSWNDLEDIKSRASVTQNRSRWEGLAVEIINYLNGLFDRGELQGRQFIEAYRSGGVTALIMENAGGVQDSIIKASHSDIRLRSEMILWWNRYKDEYGGGKMEQVLAQVVISNWIGKILFANILREQDSRANKIAVIDNDTTPEQALTLFKQLSEECNFWTIFSDSLALTKITDRAWDQLKQFNHLLIDLRVGSVDQLQLSNILEATVEVATRKLRGQYPTPIELARLLVRVCVRDILNDRVFDPCCGSGTIARAAMEQKLSTSVSTERASSDVLASDQDPQAVQIATFALTKPNLMHMPIRIFQHDAFTLAQNLKVQFRNPSNGSLFKETLGQFNTIVSNLPFVAQAGRKQYGDAIDSIIKQMDLGKFTKRADVAAYLPFVFHPILAADGRLGIIITNAWLGTEWGDDFYTQLNRYFKLKAVITSGVRRWFRNSDVVTNILIIDKKEDSVPVDEEIKFIVLKTPLEEIADDETLQVVAAQIETGTIQSDSMTIRTLSITKMQRFRSLGLGGNAQFVNCDWILNLPLIPLKDIFDISRGERRGKNELFYPKSGHGIEAAYIKPLAKSPAAFVKLSMPPTREAFSCSLTEEELEELGHFGALTWIRRFKEEKTVSKLTKKGMHWYEMPANNISDLVLFINFGERLFVGRVTPASFSDQRLVPLKPKESVDIELYHALLNSAISMFIIEGMGFGRGLGALDLNKDRIENFMQVLDVSKLNDTQIQSIKNAFNPLLNRNIKPVADELDQNDRKHFDDVVLSAFEINVSRQTIYDAILSLVEIRMAARQ